MYHVCVGAAPALLSVPFLCPNGTLFNQAVTVCDWWFNVDCEAAVGLYSGQAAEQEECPAPPADTECGAAVSTCWSPGQRDTDCPDSGLCW